MRMSACRDCHTPANAQGGQITAMEFAGGFVLTGYGQAASNTHPRPERYPVLQRGLFSRGDAHRPGQGTEIPTRCRGGMYRNRPMGISGRCLHTCRRSSRSGTAWTTAFHQPSAHSVAAVTAPEDQNQRADNRAEGPARSPRETELLSSNAAVATGCSRLNR